MVFYGWVVVGACLACAMASGPGHTFGINEFIESFMAELHVGRTKISTLWIAASLFSASMVGATGYALDKWGSRRVLACALVPYVATVYALQFATQFEHLVVLVALMRFLGPETLMLTANSTVNRWFIVKRGKATALLGASRLFFYAEPVLMSSLIAAYGWRRTYGILAVACGALIMVSLVWIRDSPESCGLRPDGGGGAPVYTKLKTRPSDVVAVASDSEGVGNDHANNKTPAAIQDGASFAWAARQPVFWLISIANMMSGVFWSGMNYHISDIVGSRTAEMRSEGDTAVAVFAPLAVTTTMSNFFVGLIVIDRLGARARVRLLGGVYLGGFGGVMLLAARMASRAAVTAYGGCLGLAVGASTATYAVIYATLFGRKALAKTQGAATASAIAGTGFGPLLFGLSREHSGGYGWALAVNAVLLSAVSVALLCCRVPDWRLEAENLQEQDDPDDAGDTDEDLGSSSGPKAAAVVVVLEEGDEGSTDGEVCTT